MVSFVRLWYTDSTGRLTLQVCEWVTLELNPYYLDRFEPIQPRSPEYLDHEQTVHFLANLDFHPEAQALHPRLRLTCTLARLPVVGLDRPEEALSSLVCGQDGVPVEVRSSERVERVRSQAQRGQLAGLDTLGPVRLEEVKLGSSGCEIDDIGNELGGESRDRHCTRR